MQTALLIYFLITLFRTLLKFSISDIGFYRTYENFRIDVILSAALILPPPLSANSFLTVKYQSLVFLIWFNIEEK